MAKKNRQTKTFVDFDIGIGSIIPATQEAFKGSSYSPTARKEEKSGLSLFKTNFLHKVNASLKNNDQFPTSNEVFIFIVQYFSGEREYRSRDIDNIAKTVLDVLKNKFYEDDNQVKTLLISKKMEKRIPQNFAYIAIKDLKDGKDVEALKTSGIERSVFLYQELKKQGVI